MFSAYGLPDQIVTDNVPQFTSDDFATFMKVNGIRHIRSAPYRPASNGEVERLIQSFKQAMKAGRSGGKALSHRLANFLLTYRTTPHATTGKSPCQLFLKRDVKTRFDLLKPDPERHVLDKQSQQKSSHDQRPRRREWFVGQRVMARNVRPGPNWVPATILEVLGPVTYLVETTEDRQLWKRHLDQLKELQPTESYSYDKVPFILSPEQSESELPSDIPTDTIEPIELDSNRHETPQVEPTPPATQPVSKYPSRSRHPPDRYGK